MKYSKIFSLFLSLFLFAQGIGKSEVVIDAQVLEYDRKARRLIAYGDVELKDGDRIFRAKKITYEMSTKDIFAEGDVLLKEKEDMIICEKLEYNLESKTGRIIRGRIFVSKGNYSIEGEEIEKRGENSFCVRFGSLTTCDPIRPDWRFYAKRADVDVGGYAKLKGFKFYMFDFPLLYVPVGIFPVKTERETGFLMPDIKISSRDGFVFTPYVFFVLDQDKDATFSVSYIENRGIKPGLEFRYAITDDNRGRLYSSIINDRKYGHSRYEIFSEQLLGLGRNSSIKAKINYVSDIDYLRDFAEKASLKSESLCKSTAFLESFFSLANLTLEASYMRNLREKENDHIYKYLPFVSFASEHLPMLRDFFLFSVNSHFTNFFREKGSKYRRLIFEPSVSKNISHSGFHMSFDATYHGRLYFLDEDLERENRMEFSGVPKLTGSVNAILAKNYARGMRSLIKPEIKWVYVPKRSFSEIPFIDPSDRIHPTNILTYSLSHHLSLMTDYPVEISSLEVEQSYGLGGDLMPSRIYEGYGRRLSDIKGRLRVYGLRGIGFQNETVVNIYGEGIRKMRNEITYRFTENFGFSLYHTYTKKLSEELALELKGSHGRLQGRYHMRYSLFHRDLLESTYEIRYDPHCWSLGLKLSQTSRPKETSIKVDFDLKGITDKGK